MPEGSQPSAYASAPAAASGLNEPLIPKLSRDTDSVSSGDHSGGDDDVSALSADSAAGGFFQMNMSQKDAMSVVGVALLATAGLAAAVAAIAAAPSVAVILMGGVCVVNAPVMGKKQLTIAKSTAVKKSLNMFREDIDVLEGEVDFIEQTVNDLEPEANSLIEAGLRLQTIAEEQGTDADSLVELVKENQSILDKLRRNLKQTFVAAVAKIVIRSDADGNMKIDLKELHMLSFRLNIHLNELGIELDRGMFEDMVCEDNDISNVIKFCADVLYAEDAGPCLDCPTREGRLSMVHLSDNYTKGSVEVARGRRPTLARHSKRRSLRVTKVAEVKKRQTKIQRRSNAKESRGTRVTMGGLITVRGTSVEF